MIRAIYVNPLLLTSSLLTHYCSGVTEVKAIGVTPRSMTQADQDPDYARKKKISAEFANMSREERLKLRFQAMVSW